MVRLGPVLGTVGMPIAQVHQLTCSTQHWPPPCVLYGVDPTVMMLGECLEPQSYQEALGAWIRSPLRKLLTWYASPYLDRTLNLPHLGHLPFHTPHVKDSSFRLWARAYHNYSQLLI
ncbi:hypothetical protein BDR04DRAFT_777584 [Suillus decipiens]|nr:hypothetical protein BDR04DRAFT_777584 [Suillus decipiens]